ncbi:hypothetical protein P7C73_g500, partial [Tremellales sp. Uapishka_1]
MLISPSRIHSALTLLLSPFPSLGPHTALLITPQGELLSLSSTTREDDEFEASGEPWLETPERTRLLLGLASQWEEDESNRVECELGRLLYTAVPLSPPEIPPSNVPVPAVRPNPVKNYVLVLNGSKETPWASLVEKVCSVAFGSINKDTDIYGRHDDQAEEFSRVWNA